MSIKIFFTLVAVLVFSVSCQNASDNQRSNTWGSVLVNPSVADHQARWERWRKQNLRHYRYKYRMQCQCALESDNSYRPSGVLGDRWLIIEVQDKNLISVKNIDGTANTLLGGFAAGRDLIEICFERMEGSIKHEYADNYALYDEEYGFPHYLSTTGRKGPADIDYVSEIVEFEVLRPQR